MADSVLTSTVPDAPAGRTPLPRRREALDQVAGLDERPRPIDTRIEIVTPENIAFEYRLAGPFRRLPAYLVDRLLQSLLITVLGIVIALASSRIGVPGLGAGGVLILWFLVSWFYGGVFETTWNGQTPGKRVFQLRVLSIDGQPINAQQAVLRNVLRSVDGFPYLLPYGLGWLASASSQRFQRLGDLACGTMVIVEDPQRPRAPQPLRDGEAFRLTSLLPSGTVVSPSLARVLSSYVAARDRLPWGRRMEIARHLAEPLRRQYGLPPDTPYDSLLCALYQRVFLADQDPALPRGPRRHGSADRPQVPPVQGQPDGPPVSDPSTANR